MCTVRTESVYWKYEKHDLSETGFQHNCQGFTTKTLKKVVKRKKNVFSVYE